MSALLQDKINHDAAKAPYYERAAREEARDMAADIEEACEWFKAICISKGIDYPDAQIKEALTEENWDTLKEGVAA